MADENLISEPVDPLYRYLASDLVHLDFRGAFVSKEDEVTPAFYSEVTLIEATDDGTSVLFMSRFRAVGKSVDGKSLFGAVAEHINLLQVNDRSKKEFVDRVIQEVMHTIVWERFKAIYAAIGAQSISKAPNLPKRPPRARVLTPEEFKSQATLSTSSDSEKVE